MPLKINYTFLHYYLVSFVKYFLHLVYLLVLYHNHSYNLIILMDIFISTIHFFFLLRSCILLYILHYKICEYLICGPLIPENKFVYLHPIIKYKQIFLKRLIDKKNKKKTKHSSCLNGTERFIINYSGKIKHFINLVSCYGMTYHRKGSFNRFFLKKKKKRGGLTRI